MNLLSIQEASEKLGFSRQWIWILIKMGRLEAQQVGKIYVIKESELNKIANAKNQLNNKE